jgi:hypothetical protein
MNKPTRAACEALQGVLNICVEISINTKADCFFSYEPHCGSYSIHIYREGWKKEEDGEWINTVTPIAEAYLRKTMDKLAKIYLELMEAAND